MKDKGQHLSCVSYKGICSCGKTYVGETIQNCKIRWDEHNEFSWYVLTRAPQNTLKRRILEAYFVKLIVPSLNELLDNDVLMLFRNRVTWRYIL